jgi:NOL1/NOP2/sun family putative RNA methylase
MALTLKPIPDADKLAWKQAMLDRYASVTDVAELKRYSLCFLHKSIRVNTLKATVEEVCKRISRDWVLTPIPWCKEGFWVEHKQGRLDVGNTQEHALGLYYIQEAASMIPPVVLDPQPGEMVLDICAAPGSKSTQLAQYMQNKGVLVANDISADRLASLGINLTRCGVTNVVVTEMKGMKDVLFDRILLDAPCSGTGTIRKSLRTLQTWSVDASKRCATEQKRLAERVWAMLKPGGTLVYSTCSMEPEEDECIVSWLLKRFPDASVQDITLDIKRGPPVLAWDGEELDPSVVKTLRIWPQDNDTEGFFVAKIHKAGKEEQACGAQSED